MFINMVVMTICWHIWRERNNRIFANSHNTIGMCIRLIIIDVTSWTGIHLDKERIHLSEEDVHEDDEADTL